MKYDFEKDIVFFKGYQLPNGEISTQSIVVRDIVINTFTPQTPTPTPSVPIDSTRSGFNVENIAVGEINRIDAPIINRDLSKELSDILKRSEKQIDNVTFNQKDVINGVPVNYYYNDSKKIIVDDAIIYKIDTQVEAKDNKDNDALDAFVDISHEWYISKAIGFSPYEYEAKTKSGEIVKKRLKLPQIKTDTSGNTYIYFNVNSFKNNTIENPAVCEVTSKADVNSVGIFKLSYSDATISSDKITPNKVAWYETRTVDTLSNDNTIYNFVDVTVVTYLKSNKVKPSYEVFADDKAITCSYFGSSSRPYGDFYEFRTTYRIDINNVISVNDNNIVVKDGKYKRTIKLSNSIVVCFSLYDTDKNAVLSNLYYTIPNTNHVLNENTGLTAYYYIDNIDNTNIKVDNGEIESNNFGISGLQLSSGMTSGYHTLELTPKKDTIYETELIVCVDGKYYPHNANIDISPYDGITLTYSDKDNVSSIQEMRQMRQGEIYLKYSKHAYTKQRYVFNILKYANDTLNKHTYLLSGSEESLPFIPQKNEAIKESFVKDNVDSLMFSEMKNNAFKVNDEANSFTKYNAFIRTKFFSNGTNGMVEFNDKLKIDEKDDTFGVIRCDYGNGTITIPPNISKTSRAIPLMLAYDEYYAASGTTARRYIVLRQRGMSDTFTKTISLNNRILKSYYINNKKIEDTFIGENKKISLAAFASPNSYSNNIEEIPLEFNAVTTTNLSSYLSGVLSGDSSAVMSPNFYFTETNKIEYYTENGKVIECSPQIVFRNSGNKLDKTTELTIIPLNDTTKTIDSHIISLNNYNSSDAVKVITFNVIMEQAYFVITRTSNNRFSNVDADKIFATLQITIIGQRDNVIRFSTDITRTDKQQVFAHNLLEVYKIKDISLKEIKINGEFMVCFTSFNMK